MTAISLRLPDDIKAHLKAEAQLEGKTQSEIARQAIMEYLARREKELYGGNGRGNANRLCQPGHSS
jgi:predicted transcriptional regulator